MYAFGIVAYEVVTGRVPWFEHNEGNAIVRVMRGERPPLPSYSQVTEGQQPPPLRFGGRVTDREQRHQRVPLAQGEDEEL